MLGNKKLWITIGIIALLLIIWNNHRSAEQARQDIIKTEQMYTEGIQYIDSGNYERAMATLARFKDGKYNTEEKYRDAQVISLYASARRWEYAPGINYRDAYKFSLSELDKIPNDYSGKYAEDIISFRGKVQGRLDTYTRADKQAMEERKTKVFIGDSDSKVIQVYGEPIRKNRTATGNTVREQWVYNNGVYIYIENGTVVAWQN
jgi:hypothetical protein